MLTSDDPPHRTVLVAVVSAALTTAATALAGWAVDELRARYGSAKANEHTDTKGPKP